MRACRVRQGRDTSRQRAAGGAPARRARARRRRRRRVRRHRIVGARWQADPPPETMARPDGRAGGGGSARQRARAPEPAGGPRWPGATTASPLNEAERDARRHADRERIEQAARDLLTSEGWQRWISVRATNGLCALQPAQPVADRDRVPRRRGITPTYVAGFRAFLALNRCVRKGADRDPDPRPARRQAARRHTARTRARSASSSAPCRSSTSR